MILPDMKQYILCVFLLFFFADNLKAQEKWEELFDGKTFNGWKVLAGKASYQWVDGIIVGTSVATPGNTFLVSERTFTDFILEFEVMIEDSSSNTGVQLRSHYNPAGKNGNGLVYGYQVDIDPLERRWTGGIYDEGRREWLYPLALNPKAQPAFKFKEFNHIRVECIGNEIKTWVNGIAAAYVVDTVDTEGFIALQVHAVNRPEYAGRKTYFRNVRIQTQDLKPKAFPKDIYVVNNIPNMLNAYEKANGWKLLFDGATYKGWRYTGSSEEIKDSIPREGVFKIGRNNPLLWYSTPYTAFDLSFEVNIPAGETGGLEYFALSLHHELLPTGLRYQIADDAANLQAQQNPKHTLASLHDLIPAVKQPRFVRKAGQWNIGRIIAHKDGRVEHYLNGVRLFEYNRFSAQFKELAKQSSRYASLPGFGQHPAGYLVLFATGSDIQFRSIKLKEL